MSGLRDRQGVRQQGNKIRDFLFTRHGYSREPVQGHRCCVLDHRRLSQDKTLFHFMSILLSAVALIACLFLRSEDYPACRGASPTSGAAPDAQMA